MLQENGIEGLCHLLHQYCPEMGVVLDCNVGTLALGMACLRTNRYLMYGDKDRACLEAGVYRAQVQSSFQTCSVIVHRK
jgi:hypothetical protein